MHAKDWALNAVLQERQQWVIPVYQRTYTWDIKPDKQIPKLWEDLKERANDVLQDSKVKPHFFGAIIYSEPSEQPFGTVNKRFLVDGQQRITTFNLAICALREIARDKKFDRLVAAANEYIFNAKSPSMADPNREHFKLWSSSFDRPYFMIIAQKSASEVRSAFPTHFSKNGNINFGQAPKILAAYWYLKDQIELFVSEKRVEGIEPERVLDALMAGFLTGFQLVVVQLGKEDDAQSIFSSLNGNAEPLTSFDLIRNDIFHRARRTLEDNDLLYNDQWKQLETSFWKTEVKQGRLKRPRTDHLITHTLVAETGQDVNVGQVANEYMKYAEKKAFSSVSHEIQNLLKYARSYAVMENKKEETSLVSLSVFLRVWDTSAFHPLVLWIDVQELRNLCVA
jgi:hypothetical protein